MNMDYIHFRERLVQFPLQLPQLIKRFLFRCNKNANRVRVVLLVNVLHNRIKVTRILGGARELYGNIVLVEVLTR